MAVIRDTVLQHAKIPRADESRPPRWGVPMVLALITVFSRQSLVTEGALRRIKGNIKSFRLRVVEYDRVVVSTS